MIKMQKYNFDETVESERELRNFVEALLKYLIKKQIFSNLKETINNSYDLEFTLKQQLSLVEFSASHLLNYEMQEIYSSEFLTPFYLYLRGFNIQKRAFRLTMEISESGPNRKFSCYFRSDKPLIHIETIDYELKENLLTAVLKNMKNKNQGRKELEGLLIDSDMHSTLLHEMTHCYDNFRSKGKDRGDYIHPACLGGNDLEYYSQDVEINAFYSMIVADVEKYNWKYCYTRYPKVLRMAKEFMKYRMGSTFFSKDFPEKKRDQVYSRFYTWFMTPPEGKDLKEAQKVFYAFIISKHLTVEFEKGFSDFSTKYLLKFFKKYIDKQTPPSLKGLVNERGAYKFLIEDFKLVSKGGYLGQGTLTAIPEELVGDLNFRFAFFERFFQIYNYTYLNSRVGDGLRLDPNYESNSDDYKVVFGVLKFLVNQCYFTYKDFEKLERDTLIFAVFPLELLNDNKIFHDLMHKRG